MHSLRAFGTKLESSSMPTKNGKTLTVTAAFMNSINMLESDRERDGRLIKYISSQNTNLVHWINCWSQMKHRLHQLSSNLY